MCITAVFVIREGSNSSGMILHLLDVSCPAKLQLQFVASTY